MKIPTKDIEYLDQEFPKGKTKFRGKAMVLLSLARGVGAKTKEEDLIQKGDKVFYSEDYSNDEVSNECFDYASKKWDELKREIREQEK